MVDGGEMSANDFGVLFEQKKFLILILLAAAAGAFKNCSRSGSLEPFHSAEALVMKVCLKFMYFSYLDFADLKYSSLAFLAVFMIFQGMILRLNRKNIWRYLV